MSTHNKPCNPVEMAFAKYREALLSGKKPNPDDFCKAHPDYSSQLRLRIDNLLLTFEGLPTPDHHVNDNESYQSDDYDLPQDKRLGDYRLIREIGRGGMGCVVYEAKQLSLNRSVALKVMPAHLSFSDKLVKQFKREAEAGGRQNHPGLITVYDVGEYRGIHYIAQELVPTGRTLSDKIEEYRELQSLPPGYFRVVAAFILKIAEAMQVAHDSGVIHRDIKPSNILITKEELPKITDFGLAKVEDALALSRTGDFAGTPKYMSPEQAMSRRMGIDHRTDIFSLGVTLYQMLTLKLPFSGQTSHEILKKIVLFEPENPNKVNHRVPRDLSTICLKALDKVPEKRYQSMRELAEDLQRYILGDVILAKPASYGVRLFKRIKRQPALSGAISIAVLAVIALIITTFSYFIRETLLIDEIEMISDINLSFRLMAQEEHLWPAYPEMENNMINWLGDARKLVKRFNGQHSAVLNELETKYHRTENENKLYLGLKECKEKVNLLGNDEFGLIADVDKRLQIAQTIVENTIKKHNSEWIQAIDSISNISESPQYNSLEIDRITGFVPIGKDPDSGLWEFAHLQTGEIPKRCPNGNLILTEKSGLVFVLIPGGSFKMGAEPPSEENPIGTPNVDNDAHPNEGPAHKVDVEPFFLSKYEMTQRQWSQFTGNNPSLSNPGRKYNIGEVSSLHPVENISWDKCDRVIRRLKLRLPSEAEWEYAARAGSTTIWWTGNNEKSLKGAVNLADPTLNHREPDSFKKYESWLDDGYPYHAPVGKFKPNAFGLHDICGNVYEWCKDSYFKNHTGAPSDGSARIIPDPSFKVARGGGWADLAETCSVATRGGWPSDHHYDNMGVRPARSLEDI